MIKWRKKIETITRRGPGSGGDACFKCFTPWKHSWIIRNITFIEQSYPRGIWKKWERFQNPPKLVGCNATPSTFQILSFSISMDDDPDSDKTKQTTKDRGLLILLREEWHPYLLPRFNEIARVTSRCREFALQLLNLHFQNQQHQFPTEKLQSFLYQTMGLFCRNSWIQASMLIFIAHRCRSEDGGY